MGMKVTVCEFAHNLSCNEVCEYITGLEDELDNVRSEAAKAKCENEKLREMVMSFYDSMCCMCDTDVWPVEPSCYAERMRELGMEAQDV